MAIKIIIHSCLSVELLDLIMSTHSIFPIFKLTITELQPETFSLLRIMTALVSSISLPNPNRLLFISGQPTPTLFILRQHPLIAKVSSSLRRGIPASLGETGIPCAGMDQLLLPTNTLPLSSLKKPHDIYKHLTYPTSDQETKVKNESKTSSFCGLKDC